MLSRDRFTKARMIEFGRWVIVYLTIRLTLVVIAPDLGWVLALAASFAGAEWAQYRYRKLSLDKSEESV